jgi:hypothetical protein
VLICARIVRGGSCAARWEEGLCVVYGAVEGNAGRRVCGNCVLRCGERECGRVWCGGRKVGKM